LAQMPAAQRRRLLAHVSLERFTENTLTDLSALEQELGRAKEEGYAIDNEEFLPGLFCIAVSVPNPPGRSNMGLAVQAPVIRLNRQKALSLLPALQRAAAALAAINQAMPVDRQTED
jgi:IclR family transcriptional regulator, acetate operon repressor